MPKCKTSIHLFNYFRLSDTVIIVACVVGGLLVVGVVVVLIICIKNSKKQDRVVRIRATRRTLEPRKSSPYVGPDGICHAHKC